MENLTLVPLSLVLVLVALLLYQRFRPRTAPKTIKPRLTKALEFEKVTMCMTEADSLFFIRQKKALRDLGFLEIADFTLPTVSPQGYYRAFAHPEHPVYALLVEMSARKDQYLAFYSRFAEGPFLQSDNLDRIDDGKKSRFQRLPGAQAEELLTHHQKSLKETIEGGAKALPATREGFFRDYAEIVLTEILSAKSPKGLLKREDLQKELSKVPPVDLKFFLKPLPPPPVELPIPPLEAKENKDNKGSKGKTTGKLKLETEKAEKKEAESVNEKAEKPAKPERRWTRPSELKKAEETKEIKEADAVEQSEKLEKIEKIETIERLEKPEEIGRTETIEKLEPVEESEKAENAGKSEIEPFQTPSLLKFIPAEAAASEEETTLIRFDQIPVEGEGEVPFAVGEAGVAFDTGETIPFDAPSQPEEKKLQPIEGSETSEKPAEPKKQEKQEMKEEPKQGPTRMKAPEACPACGEPVLSPLASYCRKCKAYLRGQK